MQKEKKEKEKKPRSIGKKKVGGYMRPGEPQQKVEKGGSWARKRTGRLAENRKSYPEGGEKEAVSLKIKTKALPKKEIPLGKKRKKRNRVDPCPTRVKNRHPEKKKGEGKFWKLGEKGRKGPVYAGLGTNGRG